MKLNNELCFFIDYGTEESKSRVGLYFSILRGDAYVCGNFFTIGLQGGPKK